MHVVILGADHEVQHEEGWRTHRDMVGKYRDLLVSLVKQHGVQFICEEALPEWNTFGKRVAIELNLREWKSVDMPREERERVGIDTEQNSREAELREGAVATHFGADGSLYLDYRDGSKHEFIRRISSDAIKEEYFFKRAIKEATDAQSILLVCGQLHFEEVAKKFRAAGHTVTTDALYTKDWYYPCATWPCDG